MIEQLSLQLQSGSDSATSALENWCTTVSAVNDNSEVTFEKLYKQHAPAVYRFALSMVGDPQIAEEITSESFFRAWTRQESIAQATIRSYLFTVAKNVYRDNLRKTRRQVALVKDFVDHSPTAAQELELSQEYRVLKELMGELPATDREILTLRYQEDMPHEEIAGILGMNAATVRIRAFRARQRLLKAYTEKMARQ